VIYIVEHIVQSNERVKTSFLPLLLCCIEQDGNNITKVAKTLGKTKQALNYHISKQKKAGLIRQTQKYPYSIYVLTDLGQKVKKILRQSEGGIPLLWRCHALIVGYPILSYGDYQFVETKNKKIIQMANWKYAREQIGDYVVNVQDTGLLKIYCPERYTQEPDQEFGRMYADVERVAQHYCNQFNMRTEKMRVIRTGHKELQESTKLAKIMGKFKAGEIWTDASHGTENLEEAQGSNKIENLINMPNNLNEILNAIKQQNELILKQGELQNVFTQNLMTHLKVLQEIGLAIEKLTETNTKVLETLKELKP
jgi:biotin operon repressor